MIFVSYYFQMKYFSCLNLILLEKKNIDNEEFSSSDLLNKRLSLPIQLIMNADLEK